MRIVVCGGGVIGTAAAYELSRRGADVTLVERWRIAGCASGKSGGFLARDWCDGSPVAELAHRSFDLHAIWAEQLGNPYGYRRVDTYSAVIGTRAGGSTPVPSIIANWLSPDAVHRRQLGDHATTAQLNPAAFTEALMRAAVANGAKLRIATITGLAKSQTAKSQSQVTGVELVGGEVISADVVILAMGPWSMLASQWLPLPPIYGLKGHSLIFKPEAALPAEVIFAEVKGRNGDVHTPEVVSRADGTVYVCGLPGTGNLPVDPSRVLPEDGGSEVLREVTFRLVPQLKSAPIIAGQVCFRPVTADGIPIIGPIEGMDGVYVATGHSVWGMLNAPGTAEALACSILDGSPGSPSGPTDVDLAAFLPSRLAPLDPQSLEFIPS